MLELSMAAGHADELPAVVIEEPQNLANLHAHEPAWADHAHLCRPRDETQAQNSAATARKTAAHRSTSATDTHSTCACAPSPPGPNTTVGIPLSAISAESAQ